MNDGAALRVEDLSKRFKIYSKGWQRLVDWLHVPPGSRYEEFWALRGVSFELQRGECLGIIGPNGAGKTTLLKLLTGALQPTSGRLQVRGRVLSLLEVGSDFSLELTGRENIEQSARLLGFPPGYGVERAEEIGAFAELGDYFDRPTKLYSSGMFVRLAFSLFTAMEPDVFLVDEAIAVGDLRFATRAIDRIKRMIAQGTTLLFVSHDLQLVNHLCARALWLHAGAVQMDGETSEVTRAYQQFVVHGSTDTPAFVSAVSDGADTVPAANVYFGQGWYSLEAFAGEIFRWAGMEAEVIVRSSREPRKLLLELEAGSAMASLPAALRVTTTDGDTVTEFQLSGRQIAQIPVPPAHGGTQKLILSALGSGEFTPGDRRVLGFRAFRWGWSEQDELRPIQQANDWVIAAPGSDLAGELAAMESALQRCLPSIDAPARITRVVTRNQAGADAVCFATYDPLRVEITVEAIADVEGLAVGVQVRDMFDRTIWRTRPDWQRKRLANLRRGQRLIVAYTTDKLELGRGSYQLTVHCRQPLRDERAFHFVDGAWTFEVASRPDSSFGGLVDLGWQYEEQSRGGGTGA